MSIIIMSWVLEIGFGILKTLILKAFENRIQLCVKC